MNDRKRHAFGADAEILPGAFGLRAPVFVGGDFDRPKTVGFDANRILSGRAGPLCRSACHGLKAVAGEDVYFLRKRSSRTTSAPSLGLGSPSWGLSSAVSAGFSAGLSCPLSCALLSAFALALGAGAAAASGAGGAAAAGASPASKVRPNCTDGSRNALIAANGTTSFSGMLPNDSPTSK